MKKDISRNNKKGLQFFTSLFKKKKKRPAILGLDNEAKRILRQRERDMFNERETNIGFMWVFLILILVSIALVYVSFSFIDYYTMPNWIRTSTKALSFIVIVIFILVAYLFARIKFEKSKKK